VSSGRLPGTADADRYFDPGLEKCGTGRRRMGVLDGIEKTEIRNILGKDWLTNDGMWFYHTCYEFGIEKANKIN
jgi:hypothetical protein